MLRRGASKPTRLLSQLGGSAPGDREGRTFRREIYGLVGRWSSLPPVPAQTPRMMAMSTIKGMTNPPRRSLADSVESLTRTVAGEAKGWEACANTGALDIETASDNATNAFLKLI